VSKTSFLIFPFVRMPNESLATLQMHTCCH